MNAFFLFHSHVWAGTSLSLSLSLSELRGDLLNGAISTAVSTTSVTSIVRPRAAHSHRPRRRFCPSPTARSRCAAQGGGSRRCGRSAEFCRCCAIRRSGWGWTDRCGTDLSEGSRRPPSRWFRPCCWTRCSLCGGRGARGRLRSGKFAPSYRPCGSRTGATHSWRPSASCRSARNCGRSWCPWPCRTTGSTSCSQCGDPGGGCRRV